MIHRIGAIGSNLHLENSIRAFARNSFNGNANRGQSFGKLPIIDRQIDKFANPIVQKASFRSIENSCSRAQWQPAPHVCFSPRRTTTDFYTNCCKNLTSP